MTGQSLIYGTGMGLATLSSQAFGAKNYRRVGVLWQRQCVYQWLLCVVVASSRLHAVFACKGVFASVGPRLQERALEEPPRASRSAQ